MQIKDILSVVLCINLYISSLQIYFSFHIQLKLFIHIFKALQNSTLSLIFFFTLHPTAYSPSNQLQHFFSKSSLTFDFSVANFFLFQNTSLKQISTAKADFYCKESSRKHFPPFFGERLSSEHCTI